MFFWKTQQKCHVIVNKLHDIHIEIYRGIEQTYFCRFLFGKSRAITYILVQQFYYVCTFRVTDQLLFSFFHGANDKVSNSDENIRIYHDFIWHDLKNLIRKWEILTCYNTNYSLSHDIIRKAAELYMLCFWNFLKSHGVQSCTVQICVGLRTCCTLLCLWPFKNVCYIVIYCLYGVKRVTLMIT